MPTSTSDTSDTSDTSRFTSNADVERMRIFYGAPGQPSKRCIMTLLSGPKRAEWAHLIDHGGQGPLTVRSCAIETA